MEPTPEYALLTKDLKLSFGSTEILLGIDFHVGRGEKVALLGPSGSGKSSLLRCLNGLEKPQSGSINVFGERLFSNDEPVRALRLRMEMIFQNFNLYTNMTALENVMLAPRHLLGMSRGEAEAHARAKLDDLEIAELADAYPFQLSGGQQQRVAIARAIAKRPDILLLDEPTSALDPELVSSVLALIERIAATELTIVCVTHELGFARRLADRAVFMEDGLIIEQGSPDDMFSAPRTPRLADFLGHIMH